MKQDILRWIDVIKFARYGNPEPPQKIQKSEEEWRKLLTPEQYHITREKGTERSYSGTYCRSYEPGKYACICCGTLLFDADEKYNSLSGWPSFTQPITKDVVRHEIDTGHGMKRVEVLCNVCDAHLGHVFPDGPEPSGLRYCINSASLDRLEADVEQAVFGGGCFWCTEALMQQVNGVIKVESGYAGGKKYNPSYQEVSSGKTGHAEVVRVTFDPKVISYEDLLRIFFEVHDPSLIDPNMSKYSQYRSVILSLNEEQNKTAENVKSNIASLGEKPVFTEITPLHAFYPAEEKHQDYYLKDPSKSYCEKIIAPKLVAMKEKYK